MQWLCESQKFATDWSGADQLRNLALLAVNGEEPLQETWQAEASVGEKHACPTCGYRGMRTIHHGDDDPGLLECCPCCGFRLGDRDDEQGIAWREWRCEWVSRGFPWFSIDENPPECWDPLEQLRNAGECWEEDPGLNQETVMEDRSMVETYVCPDCGLRDAVRRDCEDKDGCFLDVCSACGYRAAFDASGWIETYEADRREWVARGMPLFGTYAKSRVNWRVMQRVKDVLCCQASESKAARCPDSHEPNGVRKAGCPVCWFPETFVDGEEARRNGGGPTCMSCGYEFGFHDKTCGIGFDEWRSGWIARGMPWSGEGVPEPVGWNPYRQVRIPKGRSGEGRGTGAGLPIAQAQQKSVCPVCAFDRSAGEDAVGDRDTTDDTCPSCGFCFGFHDDVCGIGYEEWRRGWIARRAPWCGEDSRRPKGWCPAVQLIRINRLYLLWVCPSGLFAANTPILTR